MFDPTAFSDDFELEDQGRPSEPPPPSNGNGHANGAKRMARGAGGRLRLEYARHSRRKR